MPKLRYQSPDRLLGAAHFSNRDDLRGSLNAVRLVKSQRWAWGGLREACADLESGYARKREPGHWELAAIAFVASKHVDVQPWWDESSDELWRACGFEGKPPYMRVWRRLRELEKVCDEFLTAASLVIQRCRQHDSRVMAHVHFDYTEDETHAALVHDCQPGEACAYQPQTTRSGRQRSAPGSASHPARVDTRAARRQREEWNADDPDEAKKREKASKPDKEETVLRGSRTVRRIRQNGCWYRTRDREAGIRAYTGERGAKRFWHGYYSGKAVDHFTGGVIPSVDSAGTQEFHLFPALYDRVKGMVGVAPETAIGDRGFSVKSCFQHATTNGTASVFPWRKRVGDHNRRHDKLTHDRHGVKRCKHCGGQMRQVRFSPNNGKPCLWFKCVAPATPDCAGEQRIYCSSDWRSLVPLARTEPLYFELRQSHQTYEGAHDYWRDRYKVAADELGVRPKVVSLDWHRLRANVACLVDWLRIAAKNGWLGSTRAAQRHVGQRSFKDASERIAKDFANMRVRMGLSAPYGPQAKRLGLGAGEPPSRRPLPKAVPSAGAPPGA